MILKDNNKYKKFSLEINEKFYKTFGYDTYEEFTDTLKMYTGVRNEKDIDDIITNSLHIIPKGPRIYLYVEYDNEINVLGSNSDQIVVQPMRDFIGEFSSDYRRTYHKYLELSPTDGFSNFDKTGGKKSFSPSVKSSVDKRINKDANIKTTTHMRYLYGNPTAIKHAILKIDRLLGKADITKGKISEGGENIPLVNASLWDFTHMVKTCSFRLGSGLKAEYGTYGLLLDYSYDYSYKDYVKIRNSYTRDDWEKMINWEYSFSKKNNHSNSVNLLGRDKHFVDIFKFDKLRQAIKGCTDEMADRIVIEASWFAKRILNKTRGKYLGLVSLYTLAEFVCMEEAESQAIYHDKPLTYNFTEMTPNEIVEDILMREEKGDLPDKEWPDEPSLINKNDFIDLYDIPRRSFFDQQKNFIKNVGGEFSSCSLMSVFKE